MPDLRGPFHNQKATFRDALLRIDPVAVGTCQVCPHRNQFGQAIFMIFQVIVIITIPWVGVRLLGPLLRGPGSSRSARLGLRGLRRGHWR